MKTLSLIRHSYANWSSPDISRTLSPEGQQLAITVGQALQQQQWLPDLCYVSPAIRTQETASLLLKQLSQSVKQSTKDNIYEATVQNLLSLIQNTESSIHHLCLIGHNPGLTELANTLDPQQWVNLAPANIVQYTFEQSDWSAICPGTGALKQPIN